MNSLVSMNPNISTIKPGTEMLYVRKNESFTRKGHLIRLAEESDVKEVKEGDPVDFYCGRHSKYRKRAVDGAAHHGTCVTCKLSARNDGIYKKAGKVYVTGYGFNPESEKK